MLAKLSSVSTIVAASLATSVPERPIAIPMSALRSAGASLTPSPVIATTFPSLRSAPAISSFVSGEARAKITSRPALQRPFDLPLVALIEALSVDHAVLSAPMPTLAAIAAAVRGWSPVITMIRMPAL